MRDRAIPTTDILIFVEDPGAANYVAELPAALGKRGFHARLLADGSAMGYLCQRGIPPETLPPSTTAEAILASASPRLLIVGTSENPDTLGLALVAEARSAGIESVGVVDALQIADYRFRGRTGDALAYVPDWLLLPDRWTREAYVELGYPPERAVVCGHPHFDYVRKIAEGLAREGRSTVRCRLLPGVPCEQSVIVFVSEISTGLDPQEFRRSAEYTLEGWGTSDGRTKIVLEEFLDAIRLVKPQPYLVLRLHPKNTLEEFTAYLDKFDLVSEGGSPLELMYVADLVVGMTSVLLMEAVVMGKRTLSIVPRAIERKWLPSTHMGLTSCVNSREELRSAITSILRERSKILPVKANEAFVIGALSRVVEFIERLLFSKHGTTVEGC